MNKKKAFAVSLIVAVVLVLSVEFSVSEVAYASNETDVGLPVNETEVPLVQLEPIHDVFDKMGYAAPIALIVGVIICTLGCLKQTPDEPFDPIKLLFTAGISLIVGVATIYGGWSYIEVEQWFANGFINICIYWLAKFIAKKLKWFLPATGPPPAG